MDHDARGPVGRFPTGLGGPGTLAQIKEIRYRPAMRLLLALLLVLGVVPTTYAADPKSLDKGAGYFERCGSIPLADPNSIPRSQYETCITFAFGLDEGLRAAKRVSPTFPICFAPTANLITNMADFSKFLGANKARLQEPTRDLYADAMLAAFSCDAPRASPEPGTRTFRIESERSRGK